MHAFCAQKRSHVVNLTRQPHIETASNATIEGMKTHSKTCKASSAGWTGCYRKKVKIMVNQDQNYTSMIKTTGIIFHDGRDDILCPSEFVLRHFI